MSHGKSISVAMTTYNGERYLKEQLDSIAFQTRLPIELVICDDRSKDSTVEIIERFAESAPFPVRFHLNEENLGSTSKGISKNFAKAVALCTGELIVPCDHDDIWFPEKLERMAQIMEEAPEIGAVFSDGQLVNELGKPKGVLLSATTGLTPKEQAMLARGESLPVLLAMTKVYGSSMMFDSRLLDKILPIPPNWWFDAWVAAVAALYTKLVFTPEPLYFYRIHATQSVSASLPTMSDRIKRWRLSAKVYWKASEPQLTDIYERLVAENDPRMERHLEYLRGRMDILRFRAELPSNPLARTFKIISRTKHYKRYFNGWRSMIKDLTS